MAPAAKPKSRLSQTRLKTTTPQKPAPAPSSSSVAATKGAKVKAKPKPNGSILSFFKKAPVDEGGLFIEEGGEQNGGVDEDDDIYGASPDGGGGDGEAVDGEEEGRYNEIGGAVKRRRLSLAAGSGPGSEKATGLNKADLGSVGEGKEGISITKPVTPAAPKRKAGNPFLDDSSDEDDDDDDKENEPASAIPRVRPLQPAFYDSNERNPSPGPAKLTNGGTISREVPLLRQQTSGAEMGGDDDLRGEAADHIPDNGDADPFEDEDFTGEELKAMRYMEEQARLEAEEEGEEYEGNEFVDDGTMAESCPVCNGSLAGATPDQATAHVNSCLDGNPTPLPKPPGDVVETEAAAVGKRFAKAAVARPGQANPISLGNNGGQVGSNSAFTKLMSGHAEDAAWATAAAAETAARGMPAYKRTCPFYKIMPGFSICVDAFRYGAVEGCQAYFLSHFHSDHYIGLAASWTHGPIYCSKVTGSLVKSQLKTAAKYVVELEFEETVSVPETEGVTVTMIPANHCPGSSLFLFEKTTGGRTQRILHCGDFRACPAHVEHPKLRPETVDAISGRTKQQKIDVCYLDTTYLNPRYSFPPQNDVINACADLCALLNKSLLANDDREWEALLRRQRGGASSNTKDVSKFFTTVAPSTPAPIKPSPPPPSNAFTALNGRRHSPNRLLVVCGTYSIGKERICVAIAQALHTKIYASPAKIRMCKQLDDPELSSLLTSNPAEAQVHMQMLMELRAETLAEYLEGYKTRGEFARIVGFRPSGWNYRPPSSAGTSIGANLPPTSLPTTQLLHGPGWKTRFAVKDLVPQRGGTKEAMCFGAPYSEHSSFRELALFVMALRIERVVPTVNVGNEASRRRMRGWVDRWVGERRRGGVVTVLGADGGEKGDGGKGKGELWEGRDGRGGGVYW
ncbi:DNA repair metallo-beta-lactamase-domain-containing protein [Parachaetomium inaequale]|uniref:DNA repair metallo-beta-lactamase-domain-containing protein n=1 Tax=Parachaetomium inaequale TaxID=2588326 RepID=A0AAN6PHI7_9PEZI|nr:DNA repair metallo-beta-lactamase-domain-containing protein [Parachaetomium inaequale]